MTRVVLAALALVLSTLGPARAERLVVSLSENRIAIGSNYTGTQLTLFGIVEAEGPTSARPGPLDVVVTVRGPRETMTVRRKERTGPVWINRSQQKFVAIPALLGVATSRPLDEVATPAVRRRLRIGLSAIVEAPEIAFEPMVEDDPFRAALMRLKLREGLWHEEPRGVVFVTPGFFRATMPIPATAPIGNYDVEVLVLAGDVLVAQQSASFEVVKIGFEDSVTVLAQNRSLLYGLFIAALSIGFGWLATVIFRRD